MAYRNNPDPLPTFGSIGVELGHDEAVVDALAGEPAGHHAIGRVDFKSTVLEIDFQQTAFDGLPLGLGCRANA